MEALEDRAHLGGSEAGPSATRGRAGHQMMGRGSPEDRGGGGGEAGLGAAVLLKYHGCSLGHGAQLVCVMAVAGWGEKQLRDVCFALAREVAQVTQRNKRCRGEEGGLVLVGLFLVSSPVAVLGSGF